MPKIQNRLLVQIIILLLAADVLYFGLLWLLKESKIPESQIIGKYIFKNWPRENQITNRLNKTVSRECEAILYGGANVVANLKTKNPSGVDKDDFPMKWVDVISDEDYVAMGDFNCESFKKLYRFMQKEDEESFISDEEKDYPIAFSILMHENIHQAALLLSAIYRSHNVYCIHLDAKIQGQFKKTLIKLTTCFPNVFMSTRSVDVVYASVSRLQADIACMEELLNKGGNGWEYLINLCGQDFPVLTNYEMMKQLKSLNHKNFIHGTGTLSESVLRRTAFVYKVPDKDGQHKKRKIIATTDPHPPPPYNMKMMKNLAYNLFTRQFLYWSLHGSVGRELLRWSMDTYSPDEHYWLMLHTHSDAPGGSKHIRGFDLARFIAWRSRENHDCQGTWKHAICVFASGDVNTIINSNKYSLFANKFDARLDSVAIECTRQWLDERTFLSQEQRDKRNQDFKPLMMK